MVQNINYRKKGEIKAYLKIFSYNLNFRFDEVYSYSKREMKDIQEEAYNNKKIYADLLELNNIKFKFNYDKTEFNYDFKLIKEFLISTNQIIKKYIRQFILHSLLVYLYQIDNNVTVTFNYPINPNQELDLRV